MGRGPCPLNRGCGYLYLLACPVGTFTFSVAVTVFGTALFAIAAPILAPLDPIELGIGQPDSVLDGLARRWTQPP